MKKTILFFLVIFIFITGCSSTAKGPAYTETKYYSQKNDSDKASVFIFRKPAGIAAAARSARISLNGKPVAYCDIDGFTSLELNPGEYSLSSDLPRTAGECTVKLKAEAGKKYFYEVKPRQISPGVLASQMFGGIIGSAISESIVNLGVECGGVFTISLVDAEYGETALLSTRLSQ